VREEREVRIRLCGFGALDDRRARGRMMLGHGEASHTRSLGSGRSRCERAGQLVTG
jgi:hypothetical protein